MGKRNGWNARSRTNHGRYRWVLKADTGAVQPLPGSGDKPEYYSTLEFAWENRAAFGRKATSFVVKNAAGDRAFAFPLEAAERWAAYQAGRSGAEIPQSEGGAPVVAQSPPSLPGPSHAAACGGALSAPWET